MPRSQTNNTCLCNLLTQIKNLKALLGAFKASLTIPQANDSSIKRFVVESGVLIKELQCVREKTSPVKIGSIGITLGRSDSIAKFFAFSFTNQEKHGLAALGDSPFFGAGVYAIYYHGHGETAYQSLADTETPIYVGKADQKNPQAETVEEQGQALYCRLKEHAKNIRKTKLTLADFHYRAAPIQTGMQAAVEDFMIRLFRPIWNKEVKICYGIGKHGDDPKTRANKRSPWDTMHSGRAWAADTTADQSDRHEIENKITAHFHRHPPIANRDELFKLLSLG